MTSREKDLMSTLIDKIDTWRIDKSESNKLAIKMCLLRCANFPDLEQYSLMQISEKNMAQIKSDYNQMRFSAFEEPYVINECKLKIKRALKKIRDPAIYKKISIIDEKYASDQDKERYIPVYSQLAEKLERL
jgi:hypothetical protein